MKTATVIDFKLKMKKHLDEIQNDQDILILTGAEKTDFVVLTLEMFNAMEETTHLLSTPANTKRLMESIAQDKGGDVTVRQVKSGNMKPGKHISRNRARTKSATAKKSGNHQ